MKDNIIVQLQHGEHWNKIIKEDTVAVLLGGSRRLYTTDVFSDYDLVIISLTENNFREENEFVRCCGKKVHWYTMTPDTILHPEQNKAALLFLSGNLTWLYARETDIVYLNEQHKTIIDEIFHKKQQISTASATLFVIGLSELIKKIVTSNLIAPHERTKRLYHLCVASYVLTGESITDEVKNNLIEIKRIRWKIVSEATQSWCIERLRLLNTLYGFTNSDLK
ncbi:MAG: hypothetical protein J1F65_00030 [Clostridiales bacterium]|nr:hypothetical protein [Clostridiales bacterium]